MLPSQPMPQRDTKIRPESSLFGNLQDHVDGEGTMPGIRHEAGDTFCVCLNDPIAVSIAQPAIRPTVPWVKMSPAQGRMMMPFAGGISN
jgi:hypothetical protein